MMGLIHQVTTRLQNMHTKIMATHPHLGMDTMSIRQQVYICIDSKAL